MMYTLLFVRSHLIRAIFLAMFFSVSSVAWAGELSLSVKLVKQDIPVIVGEVIGDSISLEITVRNGSDEVKRIPTLSKALRYGRLDAGIFNEGGKVLSPAWSSQRLKFPLEALNDLKPREQYRQNFQLKQFGYRNIRTKGKYSIVVKFVASEKNSLTKTVNLEVLEVAKEMVINSTEIPDKSNDVTFIRTIKLGKRTFLYFMNYFNGKPNYVVRLAETHEKGAFVAAGEAGFRKKVHIAFVNTEKGLTYLTVNSNDGTVKSRRKTERPLRKWTDNTGKNTVEARLVELKQGIVLLKKANGDTISLPLSQLSKANQEYVKKTFPETPPKKPTPKKPAPK